MEKAINMAEELSKWIANSQLYKEYKIAKEKVKADSEAWHMVNEVKRIRLEAEQNNQNGNYLSFDHEKYLWQESYKLLLNEDVRVYIEKERELLKLLSDVFDKIASGCPLDI